MGSSAEQLRLAAASGNLEQVRAFLKAATKLDPDLEGRTALHLASANGHVTTVKALIDSGAQVNVLDAAGYSPLHQAATEGHEEVVKLLLKSGCHVDTQDELHGNTALHEAAWKGYSRTLEALCKHKANVYIKNNGGFTPLHLTCQNGHNQCCRILLLSACRPDVRNSYGDSPLHTAARYGHAGVLRILVSAFCNVNEKNKNGDTALHISAAMGRNKLTRILLEAGCDQKLKNNQGEMARDIAERKEYAEVMKLMENPPVTLIPVKIPEPNQPKSSKKREKENSTSQESAKEKKDKHKKSKKGQKVHFSEKEKKGNNSPYGCHMYPDMNNFPSIKLKSLPQEPLKTGEQYFADLAGNIKKGPRGLGYMCYCAPFFNHMEKKMDANKKELLHHIDSQNEDLKAKITHLEQRTHDQLFNLNQKMRENLALERTECAERIDRRLFRERKELEQHQEKSIRNLQSEMKNITRYNGSQNPSMTDVSYHMQNGNVPLMRSKSEDLLSDTNSNHNSVSMRSSTVTGMSRMTSNSNFNHRLYVSPMQYGAKPKIYANHVPHMTRLRMRCLGYPDLKRESRSEGDLTSCHTETTDHNQSKTSNVNIVDHRPQTYIDAKYMRSNHNVMHQKNVDNWNGKKDFLNIRSNGNIPNHSSQNISFSHSNNNDRSSGFQSDVSKSQKSYVGKLPYKRNLNDQSRYYMKPTELDNLTRTQTNGLPLLQVKDMPSQKMNDLKPENTCDLENDGSSFV